MAEQPPTQKCENCRFWQSRFDPPDSDFPGRCRRYPPVPRAESYDESEPGESNSVRPHAWPLSWCGEWQAENPATLPEGVPVLIAFAQAGDLVAARALADKLRE